MQRTMAIHIPHFQISSTQLAHSVVYEGSVNKIRNRIKFSTHILRIFCAIDLQKSYTAVQHCPGESITIRIYLLNCEKYTGIRVNERALSYTSCNMAGWQQKILKSGHNEY